MAQTPQNGRSQDLHSLQHLIAKKDAITHSVLSEWTSVSVERKVLLKGGVWGGIHWPRSLGRPNTPSITAAFNIVHQFRKINFVDVGGGHYKDISQFKVMPSPSVWDASTDSVFRVGFFFFAGGGGINPNRLTVTLASVQWTISLLFGRGSLYLSPVGYSDFGNLGESVVLPDYEVKHQPFHRSLFIEPIGPVKDSALFRQPCD